MMRDQIPGIVVPQAESDATSTPSTWRIALVALVFALAWTIACYWRTGVAMVGIWERSETFAHGFIVPPVTLWLIWRSRAELLRVAPQPSWWVLAPLAAAGAGWLLGELGTVNVVTQFAFVAMLVLTVPVVLGVRAARTIAFPLAFLFFAVPFGEFMMPQLMKWTADVTVLALRLTGIPVFREGQDFVIPSGSWSVVEACSGVRYLIASLVIGTLYAYLTYRSFTQRIVFIGFSIAVPIVANWVRAYMIVMLGHLSGNKLAVGVDHLIYGWLFFGVVILIMFWVGARWRDYDVPDGARIPIAMTSGKLASPGQFLLAAVGIVVATGIWSLGLWAIERSDVASKPALPAFDTVGTWRATAGGFSSWQPKFLDPSAELHQTFRRGDAVVGVYIGYYRNQGDDRKLVSSGNGLVSRSDPAWARVRSGVQPIDVAGHVLSASTAVLQSRAGDRLVTRQWYWIDGRLTASDHSAKAWTAWSRLTGRGDDGAIVIVYTPQGGPGAAKDTLDAFLREAGPDITAVLTKTRGTR